MNNFIFMIWPKIVIIKIAEDVQSYKRGDDEGPRHGLVDRSKAWHESQLKQAWLCRKIGTQEKQVIGGETEGFFWSNMLKVSRNSASKYWSFRSGRIIEKIIFCDIICDCILELPLIYLQREYYS